MTPCQTQWPICTTSMRRVRGRAHIVKSVLTARGAAAELRSIADRGLRAGLLFGPERAGLDNDDMAEADALIRYPLIPPSPASIWHRR